jgi:hypothetical protein
MHVVFSANQHPEMLWATFEHVNNTPNAEYYYFGYDAWPKYSAEKVKRDSARTWLFSASNPKDPFNVARMSVRNGNIVGHPDEFIGPSRILRNAPWGTSPGDTRNNTIIISVNRQVIDRLADGDVRKNYIMIGATWTSDGKAPTPSNATLPPSNTAPPKANLVNTTMETFYKEGVSNCFDCHQGNMLACEGERKGLSHIFGVLQPLFGSNRPRQCNSAN